MRDFHTQIKFLKVNRCQLNLLKYKNVYKLKTLKNVRCHHAFIQGTTPEQVQFVAKWVMHLHFPDGLVIMTCHGPSKEQMPWVRCL